MWPDSGRRRWTPARIVALGLSVAVHALLFLVVIEGRLPQVPDHRPSFVVIPQAPDDERTRTMPFFVPRLDQGQGFRRRPITPAPTTPPDTVPHALPRPQTFEPRDTVAVRRVPAGRIGPGAGDGRLWVRPLPLPPRELAARLDKGHAELVDSAVTAIVQAYLDSIAREPGADQIKLPDWTTTVSGLKFGLDSRNIYVAGLKIPAAVLALLPLPSGGNQQTALDHQGAWIAEDLRRAAQRANTLEDFKRAVRDLRERKKQEQEFKQAQRQSPDSSANQP